MMARMEKEEDQQQQQQLRALAARAVTDSLRAAASRCSAADRAARFRDCVRSLEAEKAKMEVFRRELPISVHLVTDGTSRACYSYCRPCFRPRAVIPCRC